MTPMPTDDHLPPPTEYDLALTILNEPPELITMQFRTFQAMRVTDNDVLRSLNMYLAAWARGVAQKCSGD